MPHLRRGRAEGIRRTHQRDAVSEPADHADDPVLRVPALHPFASEYEPISWQFFVDHYADESQTVRDSKMTYLQPNGSYYVGLDPPDDSERLGIYYPRTAALGGCAEHNALITILPETADWDDMQELTGDETWGPTNMRTYFEIGMPKYPEKRSTILSLGQRPRAVPGDCRRKSG